MTVGLKFQTLGLELHIRLYLEAGDTGELQSQIRRFAILFCSILSKGSTVVAALAAVPRRCAHRQQLDASNITQDRNGPAIWLPNASTNHRKMISAVGLLAPEMDVRGCRSRR